MKSSIDQREQNDDLIISTPQTLSDSTQNGYDESISVYTRDVVKTQKSIRDDEAQEKLPGKGAKDNREKPDSKELLKRTKLKKDVSPNVAAPPKGVQIKAKPEFFEELLTWVNEYETVLTTEKGLVEFGGIEEDTYTRLCSHVKLKNSTHCSILFNVSKPGPSYFTVKPRLGVIKPDEEKTIYCTFSAKNAPAIPPDAAFSYR